jgi:hypothetical protein
MNPKNKELYSKVKRSADKKFKTHSAYKSAWLVKEYKRLGGKYNGKKSKNSGLNRWFKEKWVDLNRKTKSGRYAKCGRNKQSLKKSDTYPLCRPTKRISKKTPRTVKEISKKSISKAKRMKKKVMGSKNIQFGSGIKDKIKIYSQKILKYVEENPEKTSEYVNKAYKMIGKGRTIDEGTVKLSCNIIKDKLKTYSQKMLKYVEENPEKTLKYINKAYNIISKDKPNMVGSGSQFYGKKSSVKMVKVPLTVKNTALKTFSLYKIGFKGMIETGWKRARQLTKKNEIPIEDVRYIRNWYARHYYTSRPSYIKWVKAGKPKTKEWFNKRGILAYIGWGGDAGLKWVNSSKIINLLNKTYNKKYKKIGRSVA